MIIHTVQPNETINSIAEQYGVSADKLIIDNQTSNPDRLVVGQSLAVLFPKETYLVQDGDNLADIAASHGVSVIQLLRNNPQLSDRPYIYPNEELVISFTDEKIMEISTNGYTLPFIDIDVLRKTLPYLTYLDVRSIDALLDLVVEYSLEGIGTWNIMQFASGMWVIINAQFDIKKVL